MFLEQHILTGGDLKRDMRASTIVRAIGCAVYKAAKRTVRIFLRPSLPTNVGNHPRSAECRKETCPGAGLESESNDLGDI